MTETIPQAIYRLFKVDVAKESSLLKNKAMSMVRNGLVGVERENNVQRASIYLAPGQDVVLFNALIINAVFPDPKVVKSIFEDHLERDKAVSVLKELFIGQESLCGVALSSQLSHKLISCLTKGNDLYKEQLPNPFKVLPQVAMSDNTNLLQALVAQAAILEPTDTVLTAYVQGDFELAYKRIQGYSHIPGPMAILADAIKAKLEEAQEFDDLLGQFELM